MKTTLLLIIIFISLVGNSQTLKYEIRANNHHIGHLTATKTESENVFKVEVHSEVITHLFLKVDVSYNLVSTYKNNELVSGSVVVFVNGKEHSNNTVKKTGDYYTLNNDEETSKYFDEIFYTSALYYFKEPENISALFSEFTNTIRSVKKISENEFKITDDENGHSSLYSYKDGILQKAVITHTLMNFELTKQ